MSIETGTRQDESEELIWFDTVNNEHDIETVSAAPSIPVEGPLRPGIVFELDLNQGSLESSMNGPATNNSLDHENSLISLQNIWNSCLHPMRPPRLVLADEKYEKYYLKTNTKKDVKMMMKLERDLNRVDKLVKENGSKFLNSQKVTLGKVAVRKGMRGRAEICLDQKLDEFRMNPRKFRELVDATIPVNSGDQSPIKEKKSVVDDSICSLSPRPPEISVARAANLSREARLSIIKVILRFTAKKT